MTNALTLILMILAGLTFILILLLLAASYDTGLRWMARRERSLRRTSGHPSFTARAFIFMEGLRYGCVSSYALFTPR